MPAWMRLPLVDELFPIRDTHTIICKIRASILGLAPMSRFPEGVEDFDKAGFIYAICGQFDDASLHRDIFEVVVQRDYYPSVAVGFVRYSAIFFAF
jgi:hypothetical protein